MKTHRPASLLPRLATIVALLFPGAAGASVYDGPVPEVYTDAPSIVEVREEDGEVVIPMKARGEPNPNGSPFPIAVFSVQTRDGTAKAGSDYVAPRLNILYGLSAGNSTNIRIPILNPPGTGTELDETFTVFVERGGKEVASVTVRIIDSVDDNPPPPPVLASNIPTAAPPGKTVVVSGVATDDKGVRSVEVNYDGGTFPPVKLTAPHSQRTIFTATVVPTNLVTEVFVRTEDMRGNWSDPAYHRIWQRTPAPLTVNVDGTMGSVTPGFAGTTMRETGVRYTISAIPKKKPAGAFLFERWEVDPFALINTDLMPEDLYKPTITFTHMPGLVLTAIFVPNRYLHLGGTYLGQVTHNEGYDIQRNLRTTGFVTLTVLNTGAFSGKYQLDGAVHPLAGRFASDRHSEFGREVPRLRLERPGKPTLMIGLTMEGAEEGAPNGRIYYYVDAIDERNGATSFSYGNLGRATGATPSHLLGPKRSAAPYTGTLEASTGFVGFPTPLPKEEYPQGLGMFNMGLHPNGAVTVAGLMPDNTPVTASTLFTTEEVASCPFFAPLYNRGGYLAVDIGFFDVGRWVGWSTPSSSWVRPPQDTQHYPKGWPESLWAGMGFTRYQVIPGRSIFYAVDVASGARTAPPNANGNMLLEVEVPGQPPIQRRFNLNTADVMGRVPGEPADFSITINRTNGRFAGTVKLPDGTTPKFQGIVQNGPSFARGDGYYMTVTPAVQDGTGQAGRVTLQPVAQ